MSRTAQASDARIELSNATAEAHAMAHVMTSTEIMIVEIIFTFAIGVTGIATGHAVRWHGCRFLAVGTVSSAAFDARTAGTL